jgi:opacity protein-like surface antigen
MRNGTRGKLGKRAARPAGAPAIAGRAGLALTVALTLTLLAAAGPARAEGRSAKTFSLVIDAGASFVHEPGFGHGWRYGGGVIFKTAKRAAVEVLLERFEVPVDEGAGSVTAGGLGAGRMEMTSLVINHHVYILTRGEILPFATVGVGFSFFGYMPDDTTALPDKGIVDRFALQLGCGVDLRISERLALTGRARYNMAKTWVEILPRTGPIRDQDPLAQDMMHIYALEFGLGIKVTF